MFASLFYQNGEEYITREKSEINNSFTFATEHCIKNHV